MSSLTYDFVHHSKGVSLYVFENKQFYYKYKSRSHDVIYQCRAKKCNCRVTIKDGKCNHYDTSTVHNHDNNAESHYVKLVTINKLVKAKRVAISRGNIERSFVTCTKSQDFYLWRTLRRTITYK